MLLLLANPFSLVALPEGTPRLVPSHGPVAAYAGLSRPGHGSGQLLSLRIVPDQVTLRGARASQQFVVMGSYKDGLERDLTRESSFSLSDSAVAAVAEAGRLMVRADGTATLTAEFKNQRVEATVQVVEAGLDSPPSFVKDITLVLTKGGCNASSCHGGVKGRGGFKLSLDALDPGEDYKWIVQGGGYQVLTDEVAEPRIPRVDRKSPKDSLLLLKPTLQVSHGGLRKFGTDSPDYETILNWIDSGAPYQDPGEPEGARIERIEVFPSQVVLEEDGVQQFLVTATLSSGRREDFTHKVRYESNNADVVTVTEEGLAVAVGVGETAVLVRAPGHTASTRVGVISDISDIVTDYPHVAANNFIDEHIFAKLRKLHIIPSAPSSDGEFLRRLCLDLTGTLPPPFRVREFLASRDPDKRQKLIETLLASPEYVDYWTFRFADLFRVGSGVPVGAGTVAYWEWLRGSIKQNKPYSQMARERLAAQGFDGPSRHYFLYSTVPPIERLVAEEIRVFMGRRMDCAQCHNHPFEEWTQNQFWGLAAFFGGTKATAWNADDQVLFDDSEGQEIDYGVMGKTNGETQKVIHPRTGEEVEPAFLDGTVLPAEKRADPRRELAQWITSHPYFAEATVNRMWSYFFKRGLVEPVDDFRADNPATHPALLSALARDFEQNRYDLKYLVKTIVSSRTYQLSSVPDQSNRQDEINYSHALPRALDAEVLLDGITTVTGVPEVFRYHLAGGSVPQGRATLGTRAINLTAPDRWPSHFLEIYGRTLRQALPERDANPNLAQALHRLVGSTYVGKLYGKGGRLDRLLGNGATDAELIEEIYLTALSRFPTQEEVEGLQMRIAHQESRRVGFANLLWAVINSREFAHNH